MNKIKNAIIKANNAIASVKAKPKIAKRNKSSFTNGLRPDAIINDAKIKPIPIPAPAKPNVDNPAPIFCAACNNIRDDRKNFIKHLRKSKLLCLLLY